MRIILTLIILSTSAIISNAGLPFTSKNKANKLSSNVSSANISASSSKKLVIGVDGGTESIRACCFDASNGKVVGKSFAVPYTTYHPNPGWAEQIPQDWYNNLGLAVRGALHSVDQSEIDSNFDDVKDAVIAICVDTTCCSVVALDKTFMPLRPALLWMDARSAPQTREIMEKCKGDPALAVNCDGNGPISAEWMTPKALWIKQNEPKIWKKAATICEYQDFINYRLTGVMCASSCNAAARWHWDGEECIQDDTNDDIDVVKAYRGRPMSLYEKLGMLDLADKLPKKCLSMGSLVGTLTKDAAEHLDLNEGLPVAQGGPDAFVGMVGLGCIHPQQLCLITGSSHLHCVVTSQPSTASGTWGAYKGAPLPGINFAEGGQSSTGSIIRWAKALFGAQKLEYSVLDEEASLIEPGCDGLVALETFQGSRTPVTDPLARGALIGLTLSHSRSHIWRAMMEAVCFGTRACVDALEHAGHTCNEIIIAGGTTRSPLWLQMHADVTKKPVILCENIDAPLLGCAILASVGAGVHSSVEEAVNAMVRVSRRVEPDANTVDKYDNIYNNVYTKVSPAVQPIIHNISALRGGGGGVEICESDGVIVSPSLLACDWANIEKEIIRCVEANLYRLHIDSFDGVFLNSPDAFTFGPQMVNAMRSVSKDVILDVHLCVDRPARYVEPMSRAGASRLIFQWEAMDHQLKDAIALAKDIRDNSMHCGISINPETEVTEILPLLETGFVDSVNVLGVNPGFGGQHFQEKVLEKLKHIKRWSNQNNIKVDLIIDGGVNDQTAASVRDAGANILVTGSYLFNHKSLVEGANKLLKVQI